MMGDRLPYMVSELDAAAIFPRRAAEPEEIVHGVMFLLENSMVNAIDVRRTGLRRILWQDADGPRSFVASNRWQVVLHLELGRSNRS